MTPTGTAASRGALAKGHVIATTRQENRDEHHLHERQLEEEVRDAVLAGDGAETTKGRKEMKVIYVSGPFRAKSGWELTKNIRRAEDATAAISGLDHVALCPHTMYHHLDRTKNDDYWIEATNELLRRCDAVLLMEGWPDSAGTIGEISEATHQGVPVFHSLVELEDWLKEKTP